MSAGPDAPVTFSRATRFPSRGRPRPRPAGTALRRARPMSTLEAVRERTLMSGRQIDRIIARLAHQILEPDDAQDGGVVIGIRRGGEQLARPLATKIEEISGLKPGLGFLNINLYRDDD